jgi:hypothetical protein
MKKTASAITALMFISLVIMPAIKAYPQKSFEGVITYKITYPDNKFTESQMAMFPKILTVAIKGEKSRTDIQTGMGNTIEISDYTTKTKTTLMDMMGQKYAIRSTWEEIQKEMDLEAKGQVLLTSETKMVAGYNCKKAIVTVDDKGTKYTFDVYYSNELGPRAANFDNPVYKDIDGVLLEFSMHTPQFTMKFTASAVEKKSVASKDFDIPADYTLTTKEELRSKFGGMEP